MQTENKTQKRRITERVIILSLVALVLGLLVFFFKDIFFPFIKAEFERDFDGAKALLREKGVIGGAAVSLIEALQMVVIFIPAEFIQLSSGMSYPWYLAIILCDVGVMLGATAIYFIVHVFRFDGDIFNKSIKIDKYDKKRSQTEKGVMILMYFLFFMPIIPFGAICYYASNKKIRFSRYIFTCATGVIPSICTSILMGTALKEFIANSIPVWLLIVIIVAAAAILFVLILFILKRFYFKEYDKTPDSPYFSIMLKICKTYLLGKYRLKTDKNGLELPESPFLVLMNHGTEFDFYYVSRAFPEIKFAFVVNRHIYNHNFLHRYMEKCGIIPKKIMDADMGTIKGVMKAKKLGYPILLFPEGLLSIDGTSNYISPSIVKLAKKLAIPVVLLRQSNGYFVKPKWRKKYMKSDISIRIMRVIGVEELNQMSDGALYDAISENLYCNEFEQPAHVFKQKNKAKGLENILYMCPECGALYKTVSEGNALRCENCGAVHELDENYRFISGRYANIHEYYEAIKNFERKSLDDIRLEIEVDVKIFHSDDNGFDREEGVFTLLSDKVVFASKNGESFEISSAKLDGIPFSAGKEFEFYRNNRLYYFYPKGDGKVCARVGLIYTLIKERERENDKSNDFK